ncbi:hypothetical protein [Pseudophaeobacter sp.]
MIVPTPQTSKAGEARLSEGGKDWFFIKVIVR